MTGSTGLLGTAFLTRTGVGTYAISREQINPDHPRELFETVAKIAPDLIINCAAHTNVEAAETNPEIDERANVRLPALLATVAKRCGAKLVHFSSTGCYGSWKDGPYVESDDLRPTTTHHRNKAAGEDAIRRSGCSHLIVRTGWIYGGAPQNPKNFVVKRINEARSNAEILSDAHQFGVPTFTDDVVRQTSEIIDAGLDGVFNVTATGRASRYEYVAAIVRSSGLSCHVMPGPAFIRRAPVSHNETALNARLEDLGINHMPPWETSLANYIREVSPRLFE